MQVKPYMWKEFPRAVPLPPDVRAALELPDAIRQGMVVVWANTATAAAKRLEALHLGPVRPSQLMEANGLDVYLLMRTRDWSNGTVLATGRFGDGPVVRVGSPRSDTELRHCEVIGWVRTGVTLLDLIEPVVTDAMITAAVEATRDKHTYVHEDSIRVIIAAALRAKR